MHKIPNLIIYAPSNVGCIDKGLNYGRDVGVCFINYGIMLIK